MIKFAALCVEMAAFRAAIRLEKPCTINQSLTIRQTPNNTGGALLTVHFLVY